jgi:hypothetical protein
MLRSMEKFRIAQYGFIQMVALAYGILSSGILNKAAKYVADQGQAVPPTYRAAIFYHDYGIFLSVIIIAWAIFCAYHSSIFSKQNMDENTIVVSGLVLSGLFFVSSTFMFLWGIVALFHPAP